MAEIKSLTYVESALQRRQVSGLTGSSKALFVVLLSRIIKKPILFLTPKNEEVERYVNDIKCFSSLLIREQRNVVSFPSFEVDCYRLSPHPEISEERSLALWQLSNRKVDLLVASVESILFKLVSPEEFAQKCKTISLEQDHPPEALVGMLKENGYAQEDPVTEVGEFSQRGGIIDIFPPNYESPLRIEFFGDAVESIRTYNPETQRSIENIPSVEIIPMKEFSPTREQLQRWAEVAAETWPLDEDSKYLREKIMAASAGETFPAYEFLLPLIHSRDHSIFDYLHDFFLFLDEPDVLSSKAQEIIQNLQTCYKDAVEIALPVLPPEKLTLRPEELQERLQTNQRVESRELGALGVENDSDVTIRTQPVRKYHGLIKELVLDLQQAHQKQETVLFLLSNLGRVERLAEILRDYDLTATVLQNDPRSNSLLEGILSLRPETSPPGRFVAVSPVSSGVSFPEGKLHVFATSDLFDEMEVKLAPRPTKGRQAAAFFSDLRDLREGDYVVHVDHGIGQFQGLQKMVVGSEVKEFMILIYRDGDKVYVPVENLHLIQKYRSLGEGKPSLDKLGGVSWARTKARIKKSMQDMAEELLQLYAKRNIVTGFAFHIDDHWQREFEDAFEFEETPDQEQAIEEMKKDMASPRPMDRLVCGDVGYGKTEVAMRGAFAAVLNGKQVAVLTPTTVLAFQHSNTFKKRFQAFPVKVEMLSRFKSKREQKQILEAMESGQIDIIIGTHRLLSRDVTFRDLGLVIVDEEQRFGVKQKEQLKKLKTQVDVLSLSATPIPRTLQMAMLGLRDMSVIETPPKNRLAIQTLVVRFDKKIIKSAIELELARKGQVYFVHNRVESIYSIANMIRELCPEARVAVAHGQMREQALEKIMFKFIEHEYDVLVSTTIIENGLDIPLVNTIIIDRADHYGLSELYQLRGRVGRSNRHAYAYLLVPPDELLSEVARKRLAAIREFSELGSGFHLAAMDMEIRGAGNLLGGQQHGHINAIGFELYCQLLENTIRQLKGESVPEEVKTSIDLKLDIHVPEEYIDDVNQRLRVYKKIASAESEEDLVAIQSEINDRFGKYPPSVENLFEYAHLRLVASQLLIHAIERSKDKIYIKFSAESPISPERIVRFVSRSKGAAFSPEGTLALTLPPSKNQAQEIRRILHELNHTIQ